MNGMIQLANSIHVGIKQVFDDITEVLFQNQGASGITFNEFKHTIFAGNSKVLEGTILLVIHLL